LPSAPLRTLPGVGHIPHIEAPDDFARLLIDTLADEP
jgi:pimeloyl-ACP methyl ester carboxylesterase